MVSSPSPLTDISIAAFLKTSLPVKEGWTPPIITIISLLISLAMRVIMQAEVKFCDFAEIPKTIGLYPAMTDLISFHIRAAGFLRLAK